MLQSLWRPGASPQEFIRLDNPRLIAYKPPSKVVTESRRRTQKRPNRAVRKPFPSSPTAWVGALPGLPVSGGAVSGEIGPGTGDVDERVVEPAGLTEDLDEPTQLRIIRLLPPSLPIAPNRMGTGIIRGSFSGGGRKPRSIVEANGRSLPAAVRDGGLASGVKYSVEERPRTAARQRGGRARCGLQAAPAAAGEPPNACPTAPHFGDERPL